MSVEWARHELAMRRREDAETQADGSWDAFARMKRTWAKRRKEMGFSRAKAKAWLEIAEREYERV